MLGLGNNIFKSSTAEGSLVSNRVSFIGLLNETYGADAEAAYSVRKLSSSATVAMTIRRESDDEELAIGFINGNIEEAAIEAHCTGTTCKVVQWNDQSGNDNHATQDSEGSQPTIYTGGALVKEGGRVAITWGANIGLSLDSDVNNVQSTFSTRGNDQGGNQVSWLYGHSSNNDYHGGDNQYLRYNALSQIQNGANRINGTAHNFLTGGRFTGVPVVISMIHTSDVGSINQLTWQQTNFARSWNGNIKEIILYSDARTTQRDSIEENIGDYFTQNTPLLDTYSGAAAAYSLRKLKSDYTGPAISVRNASNVDLDIGFNVFGELDTVSLLAHTGTGDGFVGQWYDQSGSGNHATQDSEANQPKIVSSGAVIVENGKPAVENILSGKQGLNIPSFTINYSNFTCTFVSKFYADSSIEGRAIMINGDTEASYDYRYKQMSIAKGRFVLSSSTLTAQQNNITFTSSNNLQLHTMTPTNGYVDGTSAGTFGTAGEDLDLNPTFNYLTSGDIGRDRGAHANTSEVIIWTADQSADRTDIETNINTFYNIYS